MASCFAQQVNDQNVALHLLAALQALQREAELLEPFQREQLDSITQKISAATPSMTSLAQS